MSQLQTENQALATPASTDDVRAWEARLQWLTACVDESLNSVAAKRIKYQAYASRIQLASIILSGIVSLCLGLDLAGFTGPLKAIAFCLVTIVTLLNAIEPFFNYRALWVGHEEAKYRLHRLKTSIGFYVAGLATEAIDPARVREFESTHQDIWDKVSNDWLIRRRHKDGR